MKNYRELQTCLAQSIGNLKTERERAEAIYNDVARSLYGQQGVPKECLVFALLTEGQAPVTSSGAKGFVNLDDDRRWSCNLVFRIFKTGPQADFIHVLLLPTLNFLDDDTVVIGLAESDISDEEISVAEEAGDSSVVKALTGMVTEGAALRIEKMAGADDRKIGFDLE